ncbi:MAG: 2-C-methyl-D-erythritol 2,4-cyclodiphosphate synthase [Pseudomonadales bacterium]|nr:2-C-methyl-D-erythritol 2,4-cyclodiphosphate synthase [Pseudomonadales bacterium]
MSFRIGSGYDVHRFSDVESSNGSIRLAGIDIPYPFPLLAHSDGDVLIHALCDALLGSLALGDIGKHFPDTDARYRNISSMFLLQEVYALVGKAGWRLVNADMTVVAQMPRLAPYIDAMRRSLAGALTLAPELVSIKATTTEGLGFAGRKEGIAVYATVLVTRLAGQDDS